MEKMKKKRYTSAISKGSYLDSLSSIPYVRGWSPVHFQLTVRSLGNGVFIVVIHVPREHIVTVED
jgi:hypothetical protein